MLSVNVPPRAAAWILVDNKSAFINCLEKVQPPEVSIVDDGADLSKSSNAYFCGKEFMVAVALVKLLQANC